jgi:hypothetical protein
MGGGKLEVGLELGSGKRNYEVHFSVYGIVVDRNFK